MKQEENYALICELCPNWAFQGTKLCCPTAFVVTKSNTGGVSKYLHFRRNTDYTYSATLEYAQLLTNDENTKKLLLKAMKSVE